MQLTRYFRILIIVLIILLIPLVLTIRDGNVEGIGWNWSPGDFLVMGALLFITGVAIDTAVRKLRTPTQKVFGVLAIIFVFLAIWVELAVDAVSQLIEFLVT